MEVYGSEGTDAALAVEAYVLMFFCAVGEPNRWFFDHEDQAPAITHHVTPQVQVRSHLPPPPSPPLLPPSLLSFLDPRRTTTSLVFSFARLVSYLHTHLAVTDHCAYDVVC